MFPAPVRVPPLALLCAALVALAGAGSARAEPEMEVFTVFYQNAPALAERLTPLLSPNGRIAAEEKSNTLIVRDEPANVEAVRRELKRLDVRKARVRLLVNFIDRGAAEEQVQWFLRTKDWSQGRIKGGQELFLGIESTPLGAGKRLTGYNRQALLLDDGQEGKITVSEKLFEAGPLMWLGIKGGYISPQARFRDVGSAVGVVCTVGQGGTVEAVITPKLTRLDGGSDIGFEREHTLLVLEPGKPVVLGEGTGEDGMGELLLKVQMPDGSSRKAYLVISTTVE